jgi:ketosteroid isomerase-like protein
MRQADERQTVARSAADEVADQLRALEHERCRAISELDIATLRRLLDDDVTHTHVNGITQDRDAYLAALTDRPRTTRADQIRVRRQGDVAILTGTLTNSFTAADGSLRTAELHALRVWRRDGGDWRLLAFAASGPLDHRPEPRDG